MLIGKEWQSQSRFSQISQMSYSILFRCTVLSLTKPAHEMLKGWTDINLCPQVKHGFHFTNF